LFDHRCKSIGPLRPYKSLHPNLLHKVKIGIQNVIWFLALENPYQKTHQALRDGRITVSYE
jgi:hypothetical protein